MDAGGELPGLGPIKNAVEMMPKLAASPEVISCMTRQWFRFAFGRMDGDIDSGTLGALQDSFARAEYRIPELITTLASTPAFRQRPPLSP